MLHRVVASAIVAATLTTAALAQSGEPATIPNGPYGDNDSIASLLSYDQLLRALKTSVKTSQGAATLHYADWLSNS